MSNQRAATADELAEALPALEARWREFRIGPDYDADLPHVMVSELAAMLLDVHSEDANLDIGPFFSRVEALLLAGERATRYLIIVGFLEDLQTAILHSGGTLDDWHPHLGLLTREAWDRVAELWNGGITPDKFNRFVDGT